MSLPNAQWQFKIGFCKVLAFPQKILGRFTGIIDRHLNLRRLDRWMLLTVKAKTCRIWQINLDLWRECDKYKTRIIKPWIPWLNFFQIQSYSQEYFKTINNSKWSQSIWGYLSNHKCMPQHERIKVRLIQVQIFTVWKRKVVIIGGAKTYHISSHAHGIYIRGRKRRRLQALGGVRDGEYS